SGRGSRSAGRGLATAASACCFLLPSTSRASLPMDLHLLDQPFHVFYAGHHTRYGPGGRKLAQLVLLQRRRLAAGPPDFQDQGPAPVDADEIWQAPPVRAAVGFYDVGTLSSEPAHDSLGDGRLGGHWAPPRAASGISGNSGNKSGNTQTRITTAFA